LVAQNKSSTKTARQKKLKARTNERNAKLALAFHSERNRGSIAQSAVKAETPSTHSLLLQEKTKQ
jgi:hypothetical protein